MPSTGMGDVTNACSCASCVEALLYHASSGIRPLLRETDRWHNHELVQGTYGQQVWSRGAATAHQCDELLPFDFARKLCEAHSRRRPLPLLRVRGGYRDSDVLRHYVLVLTPAPEGVDEAQLIHAIQVIAYVGDAGTAGGRARAKDGQFET
jgi:hypothetical protein